MQGFNKTVCVEYTGQWSCMETPLSVNSHYQCLRSVLISLVHSRLVWIHLLCTCAKGLWDGETNDKIIVPHIAGRIRRLHPTTHADAHMVMSPIKGISGLKVIQNVHNFHLKKKSCIQFPELRYMLLAVNKSVLNYLNLLVCTQTLYYAYKLYYETLYY